MKLRERITQPKTLRMFCMKYFLLLQVVYQPVQLWASTMLFTIKKISQIDKVEKVHLKRFTISKYLENK